MNKTLKITASAAASIVWATHAWSSEVATPVTERSELDAHCTYTQTTPIIPDGNIATKDELVSAQKRVKAFQEELLDFRECLLTVEESLDPEQEGYETKKSGLSARADGSIDLENKVADEFNQAIRIYRER